MTEITARIPSLTPGDLVTYGPHECHVDHVEHAGMDRAFVIGLVRVEFPDDIEPDPTPDVDRAIALSQARTRVVEAAKAIRNLCNRGFPHDLPYRVEDELIAAVDALEEVERRGHAD